MQRSHLRSNVVGSATEGPGLGAGGDAILAETKVGYLDVTVRVQHDVVQFQVSVDDAKIMEIHQSQNYLCGVESAETDN